VPTTVVTGANRGIGLELAIHALDVTDGDAIERLADSLQDECVDLLISNAGIYGRKGVTIGDIDPVEWTQVLVINTIAPAMVAQAFLPQLLGADRHGRAERV